MTQPVTKEDWDDFYYTEDKFPPGLFAHNVMQQHAQTVHAANGEAKGILGRLVRAVGQGDTPMKSALYSTSGYSRMLDGGGSTPVIVDGQDGVLRFRDFNLLEHDIANLTEGESRSHFAEAFGGVLQSSLRATEKLGAQLEEVELASGATFDGEDSLARQLREVAKVMKSDISNEQMERGAFFTEYGGFDTHDTHDVSPHMAGLDSALAAFKDEMTAQGIWDDVAVVCVSDFARTLTSNGHGTDHGWGGNYFVVGGGVKGGQMLGRFPDRMAEFESELSMDRGRVIPTTPWESVWHGVAQWWGVDDPRDLDEVLPHAREFPESTLFSKQRLFQP